MAKKKFKVSQVAEALRNSGGIYTGAAQQLNCVTSTIANYVNRSPKLQALVAEIEEQHLDLAETKLIRAILDGNLTGIIFYLKTKGKLRGYTERAEITGPNGVPLTQDVTKLSDEDLQKIVSGSHAGGASPSRRG